MKDNIDRLLEAIEHPERFSDQELDMLLADPECRQFYDMMNKTADAMADSSNPDVDAEWKRFASKHTTLQFAKRSGFSRFLFNQQAAAIVIGIVASLAVVAATIGIRYSLAAKSDLSGHEAVSITESVPSGDIDSSPAEELSETDNIPTIVTFKDVTLESVVKEIGEYYGLTVAIRNDEASKIRLYFKWDQSLDAAEVVDQLNNFEQIKTTFDKGTITVE